MIVGISGKLRTGKDTAANVLVNKFGFKKISFADSLKEISSAAFGIDLSYFYNDDLKDKPFVQPFIFEVCDLENLAYLILDNGISVSQDQICNIVKEAAGVPMKTPRQLLQFIGTDVVRRHINDNCWIMIAQNKLKDAKCNVVSSDVRFANEFQLVKNLGGINLLVKSDRPGIPKSLTPGHVSEQGCAPESDFDLVLENNGSQLQYETAVERIFRAIL